MHDHIGDDDPERIGDAEEQPDLHRFDVRGVGQRHGDGHVDGGEHHHACDVHCDDQVILGVPRDVICGLVDDVYQEDGNVGHHNYACWTFDQGNGYSY